MQGSVSKRRATEQLTEVENPDDVVQRALIDGKLTVPRRLRYLQEVLEGGRDGNGFHLGPRRHQCGDGEIAESEGTPGDASLDLILR